MPAFVPAAPTHGSVGKGGGAFVPDAHQVSSQTKKSGGGLGGALHWLGQKASLAGHDLKGIPGGIEQLAVAEYQAWKSTIEHPILHGKQAEAMRQSWLHPLRPPSKDLPAGQQAIDRVMQGQIKGAVETVRHPLRDPFATAMLVAPALHGAGKIADVASGGKVMVPRTIRSGQAEVPLQPSRNAGVRLVQHAYDAVIQHALDANPDSRLAAHASRRIAGSIAESARAQQRMRAVPAGMLETAGRKLPTDATAPNAPLITRKLQEHALRLTSENNTAEEAAAFHRAQAATDGSPVGKPQENLRLARLYDKVAAARLVVRDEKGNAVVNAAEHPHLAAVDKMVAEGQAQVDKIVKAHGLMTPEALASRANGPARIRAGAEYVAPTDARAGITSASTLAKAKRVASLEQRFEKAKGDRIQVPYPDVKEPGKMVMRDVPLTRESVDARIKHLQKWVDKRTSKIYRELRADPETRSPTLGGKDTPPRRIMTAEDKAKTQAIGTGTPISEPLKPKVGVNGPKRDWGIAEKKLYDLGKKPGAHPMLAEIAARMDEITHLQGLREANYGGVFQAEGHVAPGFGATMKRQRVAGKVSPSDMPAKVPKGGPAVNRIGGALSIAREELAAARKAEAGRVQPTGIVGGETAKPGRGFVTYRTAETKPPKGMTAASAGPVVGGVKSFIPAHTFTGEGLKQGLVPDHTTRLVAQHMRDAYRYVNTSEFRDLAAKTGSPTRRSSRDVLVLKPKATATKMPGEIDQLLGRTHSNLDELGAESATLRDHLERLVPGLKDNYKADKAQGIGTPAPANYTWVDKNVLGDLGRPGAGMPPGRLARGFDNVNSAVTAATVYFKVGHIGTRALTNAVANIIQGSAGPAEIGRSVGLWHELTHLERQKALSAAGQHGFQSLPIGEGRGAITKTTSAVAHTGANWWAKHVDAPFRFNSLAYEARKAGFDTPAKFRDLLDKLENPHDHNMNAAEASKVDWVAKRANREAIAYDRLSHFERTYLIRPFWFYPWVSGATRFAVNTALEHPYKATALASEGVQGRKTQAAQLGDVPSYAFGNFRLGGDNNGHPLTADFSTFSPFSTPADLLQVPSYGSVSQFANPAAGGLLQLATRTDQYGGHTNDPLGSALSGIVAPAPEAQILSAYLARNKDQSKHMYHRTWLSQLARALAGPGLPRHMNVDAAHSAAARERSGR